jgi:uncharacterized membrane protein
VKPVTRRLRRYFFTGLIVLAPIGGTVVVLVWMFNTLDDILGEPLQAAIGIRIPGLGFVLLVISVLLVGWAVHRAAGRQLLHWWNSALARFPLTRAVYNAISQIVQAVVGEQRRVFRRVVLVPFPNTEMWSVAFVTQEESAIGQRVFGEPCVHVFLATTPNPTTGYLMIVPVSRVKAVDLSIEDAVKLIISAGAVTPRGAEMPAVRGLDLDRLLRDSRG